MAHFATITVRSDPVLTVTDPDGEVVLRRRLNLPGHVDVLRVFGEAALELAGWTCVGQWRGCGQPGRLAVGTEVAPA